MTERQRDITRKEVGGAFRPRRGNPVSLRGMDRVPWMFPQILKLEAGNLIDDTCACLPSFNTYS